MRTNVYIDGFNLYYGALKGGAYRWLDVHALARRFLPKHEINRIRYFTARVGPGEGDARQPLRQQAYLSALETIPCLSIHYGHFLSHPTRMPIHPRPPTGPKTVEVMRTSEKGSDVNLATYLLLDGFRRDYEQALVISNDSDLALPIELARKELGLPVGVLFPCVSQGRPSSKLRSVATFWRRIDAHALKRSQFLNQLSDATGAIVKPAKW
jgi:hypothetical protein